MNRAVTYEPRGLAFPPGLEWQEDALCAQTDPDLFFPEQGSSHRAAKRLCLSCDVRTACLEWALTNRERHGVWGATTPNQRERILKDRDAAEPGSEVAA